jgi:uncharacterized protein
MWDEKKALEILAKCNTPKEVVLHSVAVKDTCLKLCDLLSQKNATFKLDRGMIAVAALLHDVGRSKTNGINHAVEGAKIIRGLNGEHDPWIEAIARICERHIGGGITREGAKKLGLPDGDYVPKTIEERIIAYSDNMIDDSSGAPVFRGASWALSQYEKKHGETSEPARMVRELNMFFDNLLMR